MSNWLQPHSVLDWGGSDADMLKEMEKIFTQIQNSNTYLPRKCLLQPHSVMDWGGSDANMRKEMEKIFPQIQNTNSYLPKYTKNC